MMRFKTVLLILGIFTLLGCKYDELQTEKYAGVWNYTTTQGCERVMAVKAVDDNTVLIEWSAIGCIQNTVTAKIAGNSISIPDQSVLNTRHVASGTITDNSISFPQYRFWRDSQYWVQGVSCVK